MNYSEQARRKGRREGKKKESCCVLKYSSSVLYVVRWISFAPSRPMESDVCVYVPSRLVAKTFGVLDSVAL